MKKWLAGLGILGLSVLTLAACGNKSDGKASGEKQTITVATDSDTTPFDSILTGVDSGLYQIAANDFNFNE